MTKKKDKEVYAILAQMQEQLSSMDQKMDSFMRKMMSEVAQVKYSIRPASKPEGSSHSHEKSAPPKYHNGRPLYAVICYKCGEDCELPFKPSGNRPVYCKSCFAERKNRNSNVKVVKKATPSSSVVSMRPSTPAVVKEEKPKKKARVTASKTTKAKKKVVKKSSAKKTVAKKKTVTKKKTATKKKVVAKKKTAAKKKTVAKKKVASKKKK